MANNTPTYKAVLRVRYSSDSEGIVNIRKIENRKPTYHSLKIKIPTKFWNEKSGTVRKNDVIDYEGLNTTIAEKLKEFEIYNSQTSYSVTATSKHSFLDFFSKYINRYSNAGSRIKYQTVLNKLKKFVETTGKKDLLFHELDTDLIYRFRNYTLKNTTTNTTTHYLKLIQQVVNKVLEENIYTWVRHPFLGIGLKKTRVIKSALSEDEISKIPNKHIEESDPLFNTRNCFVTQIFLQGMRVSDLITLRYSHIKDDSIDFNMFKTGNSMLVYIPDLVWQIFIHQFKKAVAKHNIKLTGISPLEKELDELKEQAIEYLKSIGVVSNFELAISNMLVDTGIDENEEPIINQIRLQQQQIFDSYKGAIRIFSRNYPNEFIFDFLAKEDFSNIKNNDFSKLTDSQYKRMKNKTIVYNRHLKQLQSRVGLTTTLKSHLSRSSYASMLLNSGIDVYSIMAALGHRGLNITERYLSGFNTTKTAEINKSIAGKFTK